MFIAINALGMPFDGETIPNGNSLGGSESAAYYIAKELAALNHVVHVFTGAKKQGFWDGVNYHWCGEMSNQNPMGDRFHYVMQTPFDVVICQRHPMAFSMPFTSKLNVWWLHDLALRRSAGMIQNQLVNIDKIFTVSEFHRNQVSEVYDIDKEHIIATKNGVDYTMFEGLEQFEREPNSLVFASRPERGLQELVEEGGIMEQLTDCHLYVCGYDNTTQQMEGFYRYLWSRCEDLPNVTHLGALGKRDLYELLARSMLYAYPTTFEDTSNIIAMESNAAGTPFLSFQNAALPETIGNDGAILLPFKNGKVDRQLFVKTVKDLMHDKAKWQNLHVKAKAKKQSWADIAKEWIKTFREALAEKSLSDKHRLAKHLEQNADIVALNRLFENDINKIAAYVPGYENNYAFYINDDYKEHYRKWYEYERDVKHVNYVPQNLWNERDPAHKRFRLTYDIVKEHNPKTMLDYGCAHGHMIINMAQKMPDIEYTGIDIDQLNIDLAIGWAADENIDATFIQGVHTDVEGQYDLILIGELLEHVPNPIDIVEAMKQHLTDDGTILITTPYGPWEAMGYKQKENLGWRAHIHHFERADLLEMFGEQRDYKVLALPSRYDIGHFVVTFKKCDEPVGQIDYERKLREQNPCETVSLAMIVKNGEMTLPRTLSKIKEHVDEIIIGIDEGTDDNTQAIAEKFGAKCIKIKSPIEQGFDEARNRTIEQATMNWILWIDDDETLEYAEWLPVYLRPNCYNGYAIKQHHYATEPPALFKTDLPIRLFRRKKNVRFYGMVHEHPSVNSDANEGVGRVFVLPEVSIMHTGYSTEAIRRKRFIRNFPLMKKDREKYPDRTLGKMLWVRDLAHCIKYEMENNGNRLTPIIHEWANECIAMWRELVELKASRMAVETLPFYSEAVGVVGGWVDAAFSHDVIMSGNGNNPNPSANPIAGRFQTGDDLRNLTALLIDENIKRFEGKYV